MCTVSPLFKQVSGTICAYFQGGDEGWCSCTLPHRLKNKYRTTPRATTQRSPCSLFLGRHVRTQLDLLQPCLADRVAIKQAAQKSQHDQHAHDRTVHVGQAVMACNLYPRDKWVPGVVLKQLGPVSYLIDVGDGKAWKRHVDHLKLHDLPEPEGPQVETDFPMSTLPVVENAGTSNAAAVSSDMSYPVTGPAHDLDTSSPSRVSVDIATR